MSINLELSIMQEVEIFLLQPGEFKFGSLGPNFGQGLEELLFLLTVLELLYQLCF